MKELLKWLFLSPFVFFGIWLIALFSSEFRNTFIKSQTRILKKLEKEFERSF